MAMHGIAEEQTRIRRFIVELERKNEQQANRIRLLKEREAASRGGMEQAEEGRRALAQENAALRDERNRLKAELDAMYEASTALWEIRGPELEAENENLREALASLTQRFEGQRELVNSLLKQGRARFEQGNLPGMAADSCGPVAAGTATRVAPRSICAASGCSSSAALSAWSRCTANLLKGAAASSITTTARCRAARASSSGASGARTSSSAP